MRYFHDAYFMLRFRCRRRIYALTLRVDFATYLQITCVFFDIF